MRPFNPLLAMSRRPGLADLFLGAIGAALIRVVLALAKAWARVTGSTWHG